MNTLSPQSTKAPALAVRLQTSTPNVVSHRHKPPPWRGRFGWLLLGLALIFGPPLRAQVLDLRYEQAPTVNGPWTPVPPDQFQTHPDGRVTVATGGEQRYFRLAVSRNGEGGSLPVIPLQDVPPKTLELARAHLASVRAGHADEDEPLEFAPFACPIYTPGQKGDGPAYLELKVVARCEPETNGYLKSPVRAQSLNRGFIITSLNRDDLPILEFDTDGESPVERLLKLCGPQSPARICRFGPVFWVAEDDRGNLLANLGTQPFSLPTELLEHFGRTYEGSADSERNETNRPPALPGRFTPYGSYDQFKRDYAENPVYQQFRADRAAIARIEWDLIDGKTPPTIHVPASATTQILAGQTILSFQLDWEDDAVFLADLRILSDREGGGLAVMAGRDGSAPLLVKTADGYEQYLLQVGDGSGGFAPASAGGYPKWEDPVTWAAGGYGDQCQYYQLKHPEMCEVSGCGPTAWSMLFGWFDRYKGVPGAFYHNLSQYGGLAQSLDTIDAPQRADSGKDKAIVLRVQRDLHEYCDVICFAGSGATPPGDMFDALPSYLFIPKILNKIGYSYHMAYDLGPEDWNQPSKLCATANKNGRSAIVGLGWLWHYAVTYAYRRQDFKFAAGGPTYKIRRWFRCNEGWGKDSGAWYSAYDTFWGSNINIWKK